MVKVVSTRGNQKAKSGGMGRVFRIIMVQWASPKTRIPYNFSSCVGHTEVEILFFVARTEIRNFCTALIMRFSSKEVSHDGVLCAFHYEFISCKPVDLKRAIVSKHHVLSIKPFRSTGSHHGEAPELILTSTNKIG